jgi:hypothetical protein
MLTKGLYAGAGTDTTPYTTYPEVKLWIALDSQPESEFGDYKDPGFKRPSFIPELNRKMISAGFKLELIHGNIREYTRMIDGEIQTVRYHVNTPLPSSFESSESPIYKDSLGWDVLFVAGHDPRDCILKTAGKDPIFIGHPGTFYHASPEDREYNEEICARLWDKTLKFNEYWFERDNKFKTWQDFLKYIETVD